MSSFTKNLIAALMFLAAFPSLLVAQYPIAQPYYYGPPGRGPIVQPSYRPAPMYRTNYPPIYNSPMQQQAFAERINRAESDWTRHMIKPEDRFHDFKTVAKGAKCEYRFEIYNPFVEKIHIADVRASCTCTTPIVEKEELETYETTAIVAHFHTERLNGFKNATLTVVIDKPYPAEFQLQVQGNVRTDISVSPTEVRLDNVKEGTEASRTISIVYTGNNTAWKILDFKSANKHLSGEIVETQATPGRVVFKVKVTLDASAPKGEINDRIFAISNDLVNRREIPIMVRGVVGKTLTVTPPTLFLGTLEPGEKSSDKDVMVLGSEPFKITKIESDDPNVNVDFDAASNTEAKRFFRVKVRFLNPAGGSKKLDEDGKLLSVVKIETDDPNVKTAFNVTAGVVKKRADAADNQP